MKFLGTVINTSTSCDNVTDPKILSGQLLNTKKSFRQKKYTHVRISEISTFCPREYSLGYLSQAQSESFVDFGMQQQMDLGSAIHYWLQNKSKVFDVYGNWLCLSCQKTRLNKYGTKYFGQKPNTPCLSCGAHSDATIYEEFYFRLDAPYRIVGKIDCVLKKDDVYRFGDFKSYFEQPKSGFPNAKDVAQLASYAYFYNHVPEENKFPVQIDTSTSYLHYISKKFSYSESILTFPVKQPEKLLDKIKANVLSFTKAANGGPIPEPLDGCVSASFVSGRAKECHMKDNCKQLFQEGK